MPRRPWSALLAGFCLLSAAAPALADPPVPKAAASVYAFHPAKAAAVIINKGLRP